MLNFDLKEADENKVLQLNELDKFRREAYENAKLYKERTKLWHDNHIMRKECHEGQKVLIFNSKLKLFTRKLRSRWSGSFEVTKMLPFGTIKVTHPTKETFKVNGQRLKPYIDGNFDKLKASIPLRDPQ